MKRPRQLPAVERNSGRCASVPVGTNVGPLMGSVVGMLPTTRLLTSIPAIPVSSGPYRLGSVDRIKQSSRCAGRGFALNAIAC